MRSCLSRSAVETTSPGFSKVDGYPWATVASRGASTTFW